MAYVFGPVASRRLGRSLGIDLIPFKTCPYDCIYCQLGYTTHKTLQRVDWTNRKAIIDELLPKLPLEPDYITLGGSGEPTLWKGIDRLIQDIKSHTNIPVAVLTNGALLWQDEVQQELLPADLVCPSLDAPDDAAFQAVNRPCDGISFDQMLKGLIEFRRIYRGEYWLEILLVAGITDTPDAIHKLAQCAKAIAPDRIQLNTVTRPPAESNLAPVPLEKLAEFAQLFTPNAEIVAEFRSASPAKTRVVSTDEVLDSLRRHPCSLDDIARGLGVDRDAAHAPIRALLEKGVIVETVCAGIPQYAVRSDASA